MLVYLIGAVTTVIIWRQKNKKKVKIKLSSNNRPFKASYQNNSFPQSTYKPGDILKCPCCGRLICRAELFRVIVYNKNWPMMKYLLSINTAAFNAMKSAYRRRPRS